MVLLVAMENDYFGVPISLSSIYINNIDIGETLEGEDCPMSSNVGFNSV